MSLKAQYEQICSEYVNTFAEKQGLSFESWVGGEVGGIGCFSGLFFNLDEVRLDIDRKAHAGLALEWYYFVLGEFEGNQRDIHIPTTSYAAYLSGHGYPQSR